MIPCNLIQNRKAGLSAVFPLLHINTPFYMKRLSLTAAVWMACSLTFAQQFHPCPDNTSCTVMQQAPARAGSEEDEVIRWGSYQGEDFANDPNVSSIGMGVAGPVKAGIKVPAADLLTGATINRVMLPIN